MSGIALFVRTFYLALQEIFDESAYARFLAHRHAARSGSSYRDFLCDKHTGATPRRCC